MLLPSSASPGSWWPSMLLPPASSRSQDQVCCFQHPVIMRSGFRFQPPSASLHQPREEVRVLFSASTSHFKFALSIGLTKESGLILPLPPASSGLSLLRLLASPRSQGSFCRFQQPHPATNCCVSWPHQGVRAHFAASSSLVLSQFAVSIGLTK